MQIKYVLKKYLRLYIKPCITYLVYSNPNAKNDVLTEVADNLYKVLRVRDLILMY